MHFQPICSVLGRHHQQKIFSLLVIQDIKGFSWKTRKQLYLFHSQKGTTFSGDLLAALSGKGKGHASGVIAGMGWSCLTGSSITVRWLHLSSGQGICAAQHRPEGHAGLATQQWPGPGQVKCCVDHKLLGAPSSSVRITTDVKFE